MKGFFSVDMGKEKGGHRSLRDSLEQDLFRTVTERQPGCVDPAGIAGCAPSIFFFGLARGTVPFCTGTPFLPVRPTPRDLDILIALDRCPLTVAQIFKLSEIFSIPFTTIRRVQERLGLLA